MTSPIRRWLSRHPFAVAAHFDRSIVLTYVFPKEQLEEHVPACLTLDTFEDRYAFVAAAMVQTRGLRPRGLPRLLGRDFLLVGYRIFVRYVTRDGRALRGLYILRSETDKKSMRVLGNLFTNYRYEQTDISLLDDGHHTIVHCNESGLSVTVDRAQDDDVPIPEGSPFSGWKEARRFSGPLPFTFSVEPQHVVIVEGVRKNWSPRPVRVLEHRAPFVETLAEEMPRLASAFMVEDISYRWKKGVVEPWGE